MKRVRNSKKKQHNLYALKVCIYEFFSAEHDEALRKYEEIWSSYQAKYDNFERAQELQTKQKEIELLESQSELVNHHFHLHQDHIKHIRTGGF